MPEISWTPCLNKMGKTIDLYMDGMMSETGEDALHLSGAIKRYSSEGWTKKKLERALEMISPGLGELAAIGSFEPDEIEKISKRTGVSIERLSVMAMVLHPRECLPMDDLTLSLSKSERIPIENYRIFMNGWKTLLRKNESYFDDFLDLYLVLSRKKMVRTSDNEIVSELIRMVEKKDFISLDDRTVKDFREIYSNLLPSDRKKIADSISDGYVKGVLLRGLETEIVVDGSNISMVDSPHPDLENIFKAFRLLGKLKRVPWPFRIIFDANFAYNLRGSQRVVFSRRFQSDPRVRLHSPADELIIERASTGHVWILSNDRYLDYPKVSARMVRFDGKKIWEDRR